MVNWKLGIKRKNKMLPQQYYTAKERLIDLEWIARGSSTNLIGSNMWWVTESGGFAYKTVLDKTNNKPPKWNCPKKIINIDIGNIDKENKICKIIEQNLEYHHDGQYVNGFLERMLIVLGDVYKGKVKIMRSEF